MEVINKYFEVIKNELNSEKKNMDKIIDLFKTSTELYAHSHVNLVNTILYPESTMSVKYPSDWYRPTASFRLTQTYTIQPSNGEIFVTFLPNLLNDDISGKTNLQIVTNGTSDQGPFKRNLQNSNPFQKIADLFGKAAIDEIKSKASSLLDDFMKNGTNLTQIQKDLLKKQKDITLDKNSSEQQIKDVLESVSTMFSIKNNKTDDTIANVAANNNLSVPANVIDQYRCNAAVISVKGEDKAGVLYGTSTYINGSNNQIINDQIDKFKKDVSRFQQEWISKTEHNPENGMRIIKTPKDNSDTQFRILGQTYPTEQVIMICGKGLAKDSVILIDVIQHIEFIPTSEMMDFFTPTIPMFSIGSKDQLQKTISSFPIIGQNGGLIINSPKKLELIMTYLKKYKEAGYNLTLWNILTDSSYITDKGLIDIISQTFYS